MTLKKEKMSTEEYKNINLSKKEPLDVKEYFENMKTEKNFKIDNIVLTKREEPNLSEQKVQCDVCTKEYSTRKTMMRHRRKEHPNIPINSENIALAKSGNPDYSGQNVYADSRSKTPVILKEPSGAKEYENMKPFGKPERIVMTKSEVPNRSDQNIFSYASGQTLVTKEPFIGKESENKKPPIKRKPYGEPERIEFSKSKEQNSSEQKVNCDVCSKEYKGTYSKQVMQRHRRQQHPDAAMNNENLGPKFNLDESKSVKEIESKALCSVNNSNFELSFKDMQVLDSDKLGAIKSDIDSDDDFDESESEEEMEMNLEHYTSSENKVYDDLESEFEAVTETLIKKLSEGGRDARTEESSTESEDEIESESESDSETIDERAKEYIQSNLIVGNSNELENEREKYNLDRNIEMDLIGGDEREFEDNDLNDLENVKIHKDVLESSKAKIEAVIEALDLTTSDAGKGAKENTFSIMETNPSGKEVQEEVRQYSEEPTVYQKTVSLESEKVELLGNEYKALEKEVTEAENEGLAESLYESMDEDEELDEFVPVEDMDLIVGLDDTDLADTVYAKLSEDVVDAQANKLSTESKDEIESGSEAIGERTKEYIQSNLIVCNAKELEKEREKSDLDRNIYIDESLENVKELGDERKF